MIVTCLFQIMELSSSLSHSLHRCLILSPSLSLGYLGSELYIETQIQAIYDLEGETNDVSDNKCRKHIQSHKRTDFV